MKARRQPIEDIACRLKVLARKAPSPRNTMYAKPIYSGEVSIRITVLDLRGRYAEFAEQ